MNFKHTSKSIVRAGLCFALATFPLSACAAAEGTTSETSIEKNSTSETQETQTNVVEAQESDTQNAQVETSESVTTLEISASTVAASTNANAISIIDASALFSNRDLSGDYDASAATTISLSSTTATLSGQGATVNGSTITISEEGCYIIQGSLSDGQLIVDASDTAKVQIVLDGAELNSSSAAALVVKSADKVFLTLAEGSTNTIRATGASYTLDEHTIDGAVFSLKDLTINGTGSLSVVSTQGHGLVGKDELTLVSGEVSIEAAGHAIQAKDSLAACGGSWTLTAGVDGIHAAHDTNSEKGFIYISGGNFTITSASDGMDAASKIQVDGGSLNIAAGDDGIHAEYDLVINEGTIAISQSEEALEGSTVTITGGDMNLVSSDDGINASGEPGSNYGDFERDPTACLEISGGKVVVDALGDGLDSNGDLIISGGEVYVTGPANGGNGALDYVGSGTISGGVAVIVGSVGMEQNFDSSSTQGSILVSLNYATTGEVALKDASGNELVSYTPSRSYQSILVSAPEVADSGDYIISVDGQETTVSMQGYIYGQGSGMGMGGFGQMGEPGVMGPGGMGDMGPGGMGAPGGFGGPGH